MGRRRAVSKQNGEGDGSKRRRTSSNPKEDAKGKPTGRGKAAEISKPGAAVNTGNVHPLLIPHVLEKIFQHVICPKTATTLQRSTEAELSASVVKDVKTLRLVCKQWKGTATRLYLSNRAPMVSFGMQLGEAANKSREKMQNFLNVMKSSELIPVQRYTIYSSFLVNEHQQLMKDFMSICGPGAVDLRLYWDHTPTMKLTRRTFTDLNLMSLKTLRLECDYDGYCDLRNLIETFLRAAGALRKFTFKFWTNRIVLGEELARLCRLVERLGEFICKWIPQTVKILRLDTPLSDLHLNILSEGGLKLEELKFVDVQSGGASSEVIRKFFESQTATLKVLKIHDGAWPGILRSLPSLDFPRFDELLHMKLDGGTVRQFSFPDTCPKLSILNIKEWQTESTLLELLNCRKKVVSVKEIHLPRYFPQAPLVKKAAQCFPNIYKLHIFGLGDVSGILQEVLVNLPNLEEFYISLNCRFARINADSIFSGVSESDCTRIMEQCSPDNNFDNVSLKDLQNRPSIVNLTKLKKLVILDWPKNLILTDFCAHFVFLKMASLNELHIHQSYQMSTKYLDLLRKKLTLKLY